MSSWAAVGVKCVSIHDGMAQDPDTGVVKQWSADLGRVYQIVEIVEHNGDFYLGLWGMPLDTYLDVDGFRPLTTQTLEADMELFAPILTKVSEDA